MAYCSLKYSFCISYIWPDIDGRCLHHGPTIYQVFQYTKDLYFVDGIIRKKLGNWRETV